MLFNFCDPRLQPEIQCSTISTEGYEVTNLISGSSDGFLAYSCIKPPVNIDITFLCNIRINHILIWPCVGSQKSTGFQVFAKRSNDISVPYQLVATVSLSDKDRGVMFYPPNVKHDIISVPSDFLKRCTKSLQHLTSYTSNLRICINHTQKSVPALGRVEVWGAVSPRCGKDIVASVYSLWSKQDNSVPESKDKDTEDNPSTAVREECNNEQTSLQVPDHFLDAITFEIMTQPMLLPSGKIIDQTTLQKHEETQALWGRGPTDPFTGIPFSDSRKPIVATTLKARIDKFLLENSNNEEVKKLPRMLGRAVHSAASENQLMEISRNFQNEKVLQRTASIPQVHTTQIHSQTSAQSPVSVQRNRKHCHTLPALVMCPKRTLITAVKPMKKQKIEHSLVHTITSNHSEENCGSLQELRNDSEVDINTLAPNLMRFSEHSEQKSSASELKHCSCCDNPTLYQLPCKHIVCRKILVSIHNNKCTSCGVAYERNDIQRIHE